MAGWLADNPEPAAVHQAIGGLDAEANRYLELGEFEAASRASALRDVLARSLNIGKARRCVRCQGCRAHGRKSNPATGGDISHSAGCEATGLPIDDTMPVRGLFAIFGPGK